MQETEGARGMGVQHSALCWPAKAGGTEAAGLRWGPEYQEEDHEATDAHHSGGGSADPESRVLSRAARTRQQRRTLEAENREGRVQTCSSE